MSYNWRALAFIGFTLSLLFSGAAWSDEGDLVWSTFLGGSNDDYSADIAVDGAGCAYVTGYTISADFPTTAGAFDDAHNGEDDVFVAKLNPPGSDLVYATFLGGYNYDLGLGIAVDGAGYAYVTGYTASADFPTTAGIFDEVHNGEDDVFVAKLSPMGSALEYSTFLGGSNSEWSDEIALDSTGNAYVTGTTKSVDFPATSGAYDTTHNGSADVFVAMLSTYGDDLVYSTFLGGSYYEQGFGIFVDSAGCAYVTGSTPSGNFPTTAGAFDEVHNGENDVFVAKFSPTGSALEYSTFLGGYNPDIGLGIAVDGVGNAYVTGLTGSADFPTTTEAFDQIYNGDPGDVFVAKLNLTGSDLDYATFLGGNAVEYGSDIAVDGSGSAFVVGDVYSEDFPTTEGAFDPTCNGDKDVFVAKLSPTGSALDYSTFFGGNDWDGSFGIATDSSGSIYVTGGTVSASFPTTNGAFDTTHNGGYDGFVTKFDLSGYPVPVEPATPSTAMPKTYVLHQNYPNPFNASTEIRYQIPKDGHVTLKIFNTLGQEVRTLVDADQRSGEYMVNWDGRDDGGHEVASGIYFCRLKTESFAKSMKMVLLK